MLDDVQVTMGIIPPDEVLKEVKEPFLWKEIIFSPKYRKDRVLKYVGSWKNLRLEICFDQLRMYNSWHKFFHGNNYGDYTIEEIKETIQIFVEKFGSGFLQASIKKMTIGCNLSCNAEKFYSRCISLGPTFFQDMRMGNKHKVYGQYAKQTNLKFKLYDKQHEAKVHDRINIPPTLRVEQEMNMNYIRKRKGTPIRVNTPSDLLQNGWLIEVIFELVVQSERIVFSSELPIESSDSLVEAEIKLLMGNPKSRQVIRAKATPKTFRKRAKIYDEFLKEYKQGIIGECLSQMVEEKMMFLAGQNTG